MNYETVRIRKLAKKYDRAESFVEKLLASAWGNRHATETILSMAKHNPTEESEMLGIAKEAGNELRKKWVDLHFMALVDNHTLEAIARMAKDAREGDAVLKIILDDGSASDKPCP